MITIVIDGEGNQAIVFPSFVLIFTEPWDKPITLADKKYIEAWSDDRSSDHRIEILP